MEDELITKIRNHALTDAGHLQYGLATSVAINEAELGLGFSLPPLLKTCYQVVGNGGYGPGYGIIGVNGGATSDYGTIVETYYQLRSDQETEGNNWPGRLLPFCDWGGNIFSCVDCSATGFAVHLFEEFHVRSLGYCLKEFFEMWIRGTDIPSFDDDREVNASIVNPFTRKTSSVSKRSRE